MEEFRKTFNKIPEIVAAGTDLSTQSFRKKRQSKSPHKSSGLIKKKVTKDQEEYNQRIKENIPAELQNQDPYLTKSKNQPVSKASQASSALQIPILPMPVPTEAVSPMPIGSPPQPPMLTPMHSPISSPLHSPLTSPFPSSPMVSPVSSQVAVAQQSLNDQCLWSVLPFQCHSSVRPAELPSTDHPTEIEVLLLLLLFYLWPKK